MTNLTFDHILISFGHGSKAEKKQVLADHKEKQVYMDLTCFDPAEFYAEFTNLEGCFAALLCDEEKKVEIHFKQKSQLVLDKMQELGFKPIETTIVSCGFIFPRTIVQIINEAHFALADQVASRTDIDRAMKFGVNYPKGPFEWSAGKEAVVKTLLNELLEKTGDKRYVASTLI